MGQTFRKSRDGLNKTPVYVESVSMDRITKLPDTNHEVNRSSTEMRHEETHSELSANLTENKIRHLPVMPTSKDCFVYGIQEWRCACLTVIVVTCLLGTMLCELLRHLAYRQAVVDAELEHSTLVATPTLARYENMLKNAFCCQTTYLVISGSLVFLFYLVYLIECWNSAIWMRSACCLDTESAYRLIELLRQAVPVVYWHVSCYHYRSTQSARTVSNPHTTGAAPPPRSPTATVPVASTPVPPPSTHSTNSQTADSDSSGLQTEWIPIPPPHGSITCQHKVITASGTRTYDLSRLRQMWDLSGQVVELERYPWVEINIHTECLFANEATRAEFEQERRAFYTSFEKYDTYMETDQVISLSPHCSLPSQVFVSRTAPRVPIYLRQSTFLVAALFLLSYPLRIFIHSKTARLNYTVRKVFGQPVLGSYGVPDLLDLTDRLVAPCERIDRNSNTPAVTLDDTRKRQEKHHGHKQHHHHKNNNNNNEAVVLCNRNISSGSLVPIKRWQRVHGEVFGAEDDEELLSLDVRFDELMAQGAQPCQNVVSNKYVVSEPDDSVNSVQ